MDVVLVEEHRLPTMTVAAEAGSPEEPTEEFPEECPEEFPQETPVKAISNSPPEASNSPSVVFTHTTEDVKTKVEPLNHNRVSWSSTASNERVCRICHDTEDERGKTKLISPCGCSGSAQFIHKKCLQKWTRVKGATTCEICNQGYKPKYIRFKQKLLTRQVMCMGSAASLPLLVVIIVGFFLLGEQLSLGSYDDQEGSESTSSSDVDDSGDTDTSKLMVSVCMIATATFGIFLLCCFSIWAAKVQPQQLEIGNGGPFGHSEPDVESGRRNNPRHQRVPAPLYFF